MASRLAETRQEIIDNTERVRVLVREGNHDGAKELAASTERLIASLRAKAEKDRLSSDLTDALAIQPTEVVQATGWDYTRFEGVEALVEKTGRELSKGVLSYREGAEFARNMARHILEMRLLIPNDSLGEAPDLHARTSPAKSAANAAYGVAGKLYMADHPDADQEDVADAMESMMRSVQSQMSDVLVSLLRSLDDDPGKAKELFPVVFADNPEGSPTEAVYAYYEEAGQPLPRVGQFEKRRLKRALARAQRDGDSKRAAELEKQLGEATKRPELGPEETLSTAVAALRKEITWADNVLTALGEVRDETARREARRTAEELADKARAIVNATMQ